MRNAKPFLLSLMILFFCGNPAVLFASNNPLQNLPVTDVTGVVSNASISINDFNVVGNDIYVTSTLNGFIGSNSISQTVTYPISIVATSCQLLLLQPGVLISGSNFMIANFSVNIESANIKDKKLEHVLCEIAQLKNNNANPHLLVTRIKQAVRALTP